MISRFTWYLREMVKQVWLRVVSFAALAVLSAVLARVLAPYLGDDIALQTGAEAVAQLLGILTSSMLAVTTFSLSIAVSAFTAAASSATPRATTLLQEDHTTQNVLATFLGAFLFGLIGLIALHAEFYGASGKVVVFLFTVVVIGLVVVALKGIKQALRDLGATPEPTKQTSPAGHTKQPAASVVDKPRSANLRVRQTFSEADKDTFIEEAFEFMARYFEGSLAELQERHQQITTRFRRIDALTFTAVIYRDGQACSRCFIQRGRRTSGGDITYSMTDTPNPGSYNEALSVVVGEQSLFLQPLGMQMGYGRDENSRLTFEDAAEFYWSILIAPLQP